MSARPKSSGEGKSARSAQQPLKPGEKVIPHDGPKQAVFDNPKKAQAFFKSMDKDKEKKLSEKNFCKGMKDFLEEFNISDAGVKALWNQTDTNLDGYVTWDEFRIRFVEDNTRNFMLRQELPELQEDHSQILHGVRELIVAIHRSDDRTDVLWEVIKGLGLDENMKFTIKNFKACLDAFSLAERARVEKAGEPVPQWVEAYGGYGKEELLGLHEIIELKDNGKLRLDRLQRRLGFELDIAPELSLNYKKRLQEVKVKGKAAAVEEEDAPPSTSASARPGSGKDGKKKEKKPKNAAIQLKTLLPALQLEWLSFEIFSELLKEKREFPFRCAPSLKNWTASEKTRWGLEESTGERCYIFLSDHVQIKKIIKEEESKLPCAFVTFRTELNGLHTQEWFYHAKIWLDKHENVRKIQIRPTKAYRNGGPVPMQKGQALKDFRDWLEHSPVPDEDGSMIKQKEY